MPLIVVSSNCQTAGLAATLSEIFGAESVVAHPLPAANDSDEEHRLAERLMKADAWVSAASFDLLQRYKVVQANPRLKTVKTPDIRFAAFHPDLCYAKRISTGELVVPHYNSAIAVWCYRKGLSEAEAASLFTRPVFEALGYFNTWNASAMQLRQYFTAFEMGDQFERFYLHVKRHGNFMHSINHPKPCALVQLGKIVALKLGVDERVLRADINIADGLAGDFQWPLYPDVADALGLEGGSYRWKSGPRNWAVGVENYVRVSYETYRSQGIAPEDIEITFYDDSRHDTVLNAVLSAARSA